MKKLLVATVMTTLVLSFCNGESWWKKLANKVDSIDQQKIEKKINAKKFFEHFAHNAWDMAEPGALFWDRIQNYNLCSDIPEYRLESTNPCAEEPLPPGGA